MCGFICVFGEDPTRVVPEVLRGLLSIQHRGQDAAGLVSFSDRFHAKKGLGLVREVFAEKHLDRLAGTMAVGHVRYPTVGGGAEPDVQPFWMDFPLGIAMAHNGNVTNFLDLKRNYFPGQDIHLASDCDLEAVLYVFAAALISQGTGPITPDRVFAAVEEVYRRVKGSYSVVGILGGQGIFAFRDPYGIKPIVLGERTNGGRSFAVASESVVLDVNGYENQRDLAAGEAVFIDKQRRIHARRLADKPHRPCIFELVYFARPDSFLDEVSVYKARLRMGEYLAERWRGLGLEADVVIPVPESARIAALAMAQALGLPFREGFVKNRYIGRTFIMPSDEARRSSVRAKLNTISLEFAPETGPPGGRLDRAGPHVPPVDPSGPEGWGHQGLSGLLLAAPAPSLSLWHRHGHAQGVHRPGIGRGRCGPGDRRRSGDLSGPGGPGAGRTEGESPAPVLLQGLFRRSLSHR